MNQKKKKKKSWVFKKLEKHEKHFYRLYCILRLFPEVCLKTNKQTKKSKQIDCDSVAL